MKPEIMESMVVRPVLELMTEHNENLNSDAAVQLMMGTIAQESDFGTYNTQLGGGPGLGICQVEPETEIDIRTRYIKRHPTLQEIMYQVVSGHGDSDEFFHSQLESNWKYCVFVARIKFWMQPEPLPEAGDFSALGQYWDVHFNANDEHGTVEEWLESYNFYIN